MLRAEERVSQMKRTLGYYLGGRVETHSRSLHSLFGIRVANTSLLATEVEGKLAY